MSHAAPRRHFADKQALLDALAAGRVRAARAPSWARRWRRRAFDAQLHAMARTYVRFATAARRAARADVHGQAPAGRGPGVGEAAERALTPMLGVIVAGQEAGEVVAGDPEQVGAAVFAMVQGLAALVESAGCSTRPRSTRRSSG